MSDKRAELEALATEMVQQAGLSQLSFRTLAERSGIKSSSVHYHFPEKADLAAVLIESYTAAFARKLAAIDAEAKPFDKRLMAFVGIFEGVAKEERMCLCGMMAAEVTTLDERCRTLLYDYFAQAEDWLCRLFEAHAAERADALKPRALARVVMSGLEGALLLDRVDGRGERLRAQREWIRSLVA